MSGFVVIVEVVFIFGQDVYVLRFYSRLDESKKGEVSLLFYFF